MLSLCFKVPRNVKSLDFQIRTSIILLVCVCLVFVTKLFLKLYWEFLQSHLWSYL